MGDTEMNFMKMPPLKSGYVWSNVAPLGEKPEWVAIPDIQSSGKLFGYDTADFMQRQYK